MTDWTLAIETVATAGSVTLLQAGEVRAAEVLPAESRSAKTLAAGVQRVWVKLGKPAISLVAVARGPGSFTGLRVGITTAKALAYAWGAKLFGVSTLDAIAAGVGGSEVRDQGSGSQALQVVLDAQRKELFVARYEYLEGGWSRRDECILGLEEWLAQLTPGTLVSGPALQKLRDRLPTGVDIAPEATWQPRAEFVGRLALAQDPAGAVDELWSLKPSYLRPSYAEEPRNRGTKTES